jgi:hypothetical protein
VGTSITVVHVCGGRVIGRGAAAGVYFQATDGHAQRVPVKALARAFDAAGSVKLVVLDTCYSEEPAAAVAAHIDCVVGMAGETVDGAATSFAVGLYGGLGEGESVASAFKHGCAAIGVAGAGDPDQPQLRVRPGVDANGLVLTEPTERTNHGRVDAGMTRAEPLPEHGARQRRVDAAGNVTACDETGVGASQDDVKSGGDVTAIVTAPRNGGIREKQPRGRFRVGRRPGSARASASSAGPAPCSPERVPPGSRRG